MNGVVQKIAKKKLLKFLYFLGVFDIYKCEGMRTDEMRKEEINV